MVELPRLPRQFVIDAREQASRPRRSGGNGHLQPAAPEVRDEFRRLMATAGIQPHHEQELVICPWHADKAPSLSINWPGAMFNCFGCDEGGGLRRLRELLRVAKKHPPPSAEPREPARFDAERERLRLAAALQDAGVQHFGSHLTKVAECHTTFSKYQCPSDGRRKILASSCGHRLCPSCLPSRLRADFKRHRANLPECVSTYIWKPPEVCTDRRNVAAAFKRWRREHGLTAGFYGLRSCFDHGTLAFDLLLVLPPGQAPADVTLVAADVDIDTAISWYTQMFLEEATSWQTTEEMLALLAAVKGQRRFQGFGQCFEKAVADAAEKQLSSDRAKNLGRVSGGSGKGGRREPVICDHCGARMRYVGVARSQEEAEAWLHPPPPLVSDYNCSGEGTSASLREPVTAG